jgi:histidinol-phosphate aminotransferase
MKLSQLANPRILDQPVYQPGKPIEQVALEYKLDPKKVCKLASNENPWGASPLAIAAGKTALDQVHLYPEGSGEKLRNAIGDKLQMDAAQIILGNGSNEIIELLGHIFLEDGDEVIVGEHAFVVYKLMAMLMGATPVIVPMPNLVHDLDEMGKAVTDKTKLIFLPSPNNPTGTSNSSDEIIRFVESLPDHVVFCMDEAYAEYVEKPADLRPLMRLGKKIVAMRTFSKIHGLAGLRIGYAYGDKDMIELLQKVRQPFNANSIAQTCAIAALNDNSWVEQCRKRNLAGLKQMSAGLKILNLEYVPSQANFLLVKVGDGQTIFESLQKLGIITRPMPKSLNEYVRISIGTEEENTKALHALTRIIEPAQSS